MSETKSRKRILGPVLVISVALLLFQNWTSVRINKTTAERLATRHVSQIYDSPEDYQGRITKVTGKVVSSGYLINCGYFVLEDLEDNATILVITRQFSPDKYQKITVPVKIIPGFKMDGVSSIWAIEARIE